MTDLEDPLQEYQGLSLFPRTLASLPNPPHPHLSNDPHFIHNFLKALPVKNPKKLMEQAKNILDNTIEVPNVKMIDDASKENNEAVADMAMKYPRGQRPGLQLQRKRPRFSLIPSISEPTVNPEPTFDFDKYKDPEEFFIAYERLENAKKEIAKQTGRVFTDCDKYNVFMVPQSQRPGIPGRSKTAKYKHLYSAMPSQNTCEGDILSNRGSQSETTQPGAVSQQTEPATVASQLLESTNDASQQTKLTNVALEEMELAGSISKGENRVNQLLHELLSNDYGEVAGDRAANLLQEHLQIKPIHIEKLNLPEMQDIERLDFKVSEKNSKPRNTLSNINNFLNGPRNTTPLELKKTESSVSGFGSPTPPKSPLASLSLLKKHIFQSNPSSDPFSFDDIAQSPARNASPAKRINDHSDQVDSEKTFCISGDLESPTREKDDVPGGRGSSSEVAIEDCTSCFEKQVNENLSSLRSGSEIGPRESESELEKNEVYMGNEFINDNSSQDDIDVNLRKNIPHDMEDMVEDVLQDTEASAQVDDNTDDFPVTTSSINDGLDQLNPAPADKHASNECPDIQDGSPKQIEETALEQHIEKLQEPSMVSTKKQSKRKLQSRKGRHKVCAHREDPAIVEVHPVDVSAENMDSASVQTQEIALEQTQVSALKLLDKKILEPSAVSTNEQTKGKALPGKERKSKILSGRQSLAGCGMSWEAGVRRSTRIRSRPLEYWKGERFLYGRIHQSLATIIGIKYASPGKENGGPTLKVKSFVSNEYKDLVEQAALY